MQPQLRLPSPSCEVVAFLKAVPHLDFLPGRILKLVFIHVSSMGHGHQLTTRWDGYPSHYTGINEKSERGGTSQDQIVLAMKSANSNCEQTVRRFSLWDIFGLTTLCAATLGLSRMLGPSLSFSCFLAAYAFAPAIALGVIWIFRQHSRRSRIVIGGSTLVLFAISMIGICGYFYGVEAMPFVLAGTLIEWPGQIGVLLCLRQIRLAQIGS